MDVLTIQDRDAWDEYVYNSEQTTVFHLSGWKDVMEKTYGLRSHFLTAVEGDVIRGILPLLQVKSRISGHFFTSMPGSLCTDNNTAAHALIEHAKELVRSSNASYLILRDSHQKWDLPELITDEDHCTFLVKLCDDPDQMWKKIDRRVRQHTQKAINMNMEVRVGPQYLDDFYRTYAQTMREMGTPTLGRNFFEIVFKEFPNHFTTVIVHRDEQLLGGIVAATFKDTFYNVWWGMLSEYYELRSCHILYWETMKYGCENEFQCIDLGRSMKDSGTYNFKIRWPVTPEPLYQQFFLNRISEPPAVGNNIHEDTWYRLFVKVWRQLPLPLIETLGPQLRKRMPFG